MTNRSTFDLAILGRFMECPLLAVKRSKSLDTKETSMGWSPDFASSIRIVVKRALCLL